MSIKNKKSILNKFSKLRVGVIGDLMLDRYIYGETFRMSPEAPVPVVVAGREVSAAGGAANLACNIASLGATAHMVGVVGHDEAGKELLQILKKRGINNDGIFRYRAKPTTQKTRIIVKNRHMVRLDKEDTTDINRATENILIRFVQGAFKEWDVVVVSDYAKGLVTKRLARALVECANRYKKILVVDTKPAHFLFFKGAYIVTPNKSESEGIVHREILNHADVVAAGREMQALLRAHILMKLGADGVALFEKKRCTRFRSTARSVVDVVGAGDTVVAVLALALAGGASLKRAAALANNAGGMVVQKPGTATLSIFEL